MPVTLQVLYPISEGATFDYDYYTTTHFGIVKEILGGNGMTSDSASKGLAGGPDVASPFFAIWTGVFPDMATLEGALAVAGPVLADIPNYTNVAPQMMIGETL